MEKNFGRISIYTRRPVDRRRAKDRRLFLKQEYLEHHPERRVNMIERRMLGDRRQESPGIMKTFREAAP
jgi:hypothetical protein